MVPDCIEKHKKKKTFLPTFLLLVRLDSNLKHVKLKKKILH